MSKMNFSERVNAVFAENNTNYEEIKNLMFDLAKNELSDGVSKREAEETLREFTRQIFGVTKDSSRRDIRNARLEHEREFFSIIEEVLDFVVTTGLTDNEWFNELVNYKNIALGDENLFVNKDLDVVLSVARMGRRHHDTILQRLPAKKTFSIETDVYGAAVGADIDRYIIGQEDWSDLVDHVAKAFIVLVQNLVMTALASAVDKLPAKSQFVKTVAFTSANKRIIDKLLQDVSVANGNAPVTIMGTTVGLQNFENLVNINWIANSSKEQVATMGRLANYGPYQLVEIPQRFALNDTTRTVYNDDVLWVFAAGDDKLVDVIDVGETLIDEISDRGEANGRIDDTMKYEAQREFGVAARAGRYFGQITVDHE